MSQDKKVTVAKKEKTFMEKIGQIGQVALISGVSFLVGGHIEQDHRLDAHDIINTRQDTEIQALKDKLDPIIRKIIREELGVDIDALKKDMAEARQEIRDWKKP